MPAAHDDEDDFLSDVIPCAGSVACCTAQPSASLQTSRCTAFYASVPTRANARGILDSKRTPWRQTRPSFSVRVWWRPPSHMVGGNVSLCRRLSGRPASAARLPPRYVMPRRRLQSPAALRNALAVSAADIEWLTLDAWGGLLGAARRNSICTELSHPLTELVPALHDWLEQSSKQGDDANRRAARQLLENDLPDPLPEMLFTALYSKVSWCNHSCKPNAEVHFFNESDEASLIATRDIESGEEVFISYIDGNDRWNVKERRASLADYGFTCDCIKCEQESGWQRRLRPRLV